MLPPLRSVRSCAGPEGTSVVCDGQRVSTECTPKPRRLAGDTLHFAAKLLAIE